MKAAGAHAHSSQGKSPAPTSYASPEKCLSQRELTVLPGCKFTPKMCTSFDLSITFNMVSNVLRIPIAVTAFSSLSSPSKSWTNVPAYRCKQSEIIKKVV